MKGENGSLGGLTHDRYPFWHRSEKEIKKQDNARKALVERIRKRVGMDPPNGRE